MNEYIKQQIDDSIKIKQVIFNDEILIDSIANISELIVLTIKNGNKIMIAGNGGSAADAQHVAGEFVNKFYFDRAPMPCIALSTDTSVITAIGNDYGFEQIFSKQIEAIGKKNDIFIGISTSANSKNIVKAMKSCRDREIITIALTGQTIGEMDCLSNYAIKVPSAETPRIQEAHIMIEHIICAIVEREYFKK